MPNQPIKLSLILVFLLSINTSNAEQLSGEAEFRAALETRKTLIPLIESYFGSDEERQRSAKNTIEDQSDRAAALLKQYNAQIKDSANLGFAPAQFTYALTLKSQATTASSEKSALQAEACDLLNRAAERGLLAAALGRGLYCSGLSLRSNDEMIAKQTKKIAHELTYAITITDPYINYYPFQAMQPLNCFERQESNSGSDATLWQKIIQNQHPLITYEQTKAEAYYQLAYTSEPGEETQAKNYLDQAEVLGCMAERVATIRTFLDRRATK